MLSCVSCLEGQPFWRQTERFPKVLLRPAERKPSIQKEEYRWHLINRFYADCIGAFFIPLAGLNG